MPPFMVERDFSISVRVLSQCAGAGIDLYANWVTMVLSKDFNLSVRGQRNINTALNNLPVYFTPERSLTLGWTLDHALRNQGVHESGYEHLALEALLSETFPERYVARVLYEMAIMHAEQSDIVPHFGQLRSLVRSSSGIFTSSDFGLLVEEYIRLDPYNGAFQGGLENSSSVPSPKSLSRALNSLSHVASGCEKQITVSGGPVIGWFAAVVEWLFDLRIAIYSSSGERLYVNHKNVGTQVLLIYVGKPGIHAQVESWAQDSVHATEVAARQQGDAEIISPIQFGGRIVWSSLFLQVFGQSFYRLNHDESNTLATAIGAAARVLEGHAAGNDSGDFVPARNQPSPTPFGHSLVQTLAEWLPELSRLQGRIERQLKMPFEEARNVYFQQIHNLQQVCGCGVCAPTDANTSSSNFTHPRHGYCLTVLVEVIIALGLTLSKVAVAAQIYPTRPGIQNFYANQVAQRIQANNIGTDDIREFYSHYLNDSDADRLQVCAAIFSGSMPVQDVPGNIIALAHEGICVYLAKLEKPEGPARTETGGLIRVVSGAICVRQKVFTRACLGPVADTDEFENVWEQVHCAHLSQPLYCK